MFYGSPSPFGGSKDAEYRRTIEMLVEKTGKTKEEVMYILYFLYDSQYDNQDLKNMAELIHDNLTMQRNRIKD